MKKKTLTGVKLRKPEAEQGYKDRPIKTAHLLKTIYTSGILLTCEDC